MLRNGTRMTLMKRISADLVASLHLFLAKTPRCKGTDLSRFRDAPRCCTQRRGERREAVHSPERASSSNAGRKPCDAVPSTEPSPERAI